MIINIVLIFLIYVVVDSKLLRSIRPITNGIQNLSNGSPVCIKEKGVFAELAEKINKTSKILQMQAEQLRKKKLQGQTGSRAFPMMSEHRCQ